MNINELPTPVSNVDVFLSTIANGGISTEVILQNAVTTTGNGTDFVVGTNKTLRVDIFGTATARTINFYHVNSNGDTVPIQGYNISTASLATNTTGITPETWVFEVTALNKVRMAVSAISGGNLTIKGTVVS